MQMNKTDLIKMVAEKANKPTKEVAEIIDSFFKELSRNPATGEPVEVPEKEVVKFKPSKNILNMKWL